MKQEPGSRHWQLFGLLLLVSVAANVTCCADAVVSPEIAGCYALNYTKEDLNPAEPRSFEGFVRGISTGLQAPYLKIIDQDIGKNYEFLFFNSEKAFRIISRIEKKRNHIRATSAGIEFVVYSGQSSLGVSDLQTNRIRIAVARSGNLTVTVTAERDTRTFWILGEKKTHVYVLEMTRLAKCNVPKVTESVRVVDIPGER